MIKKFIDSIIALFKKDHAAASAKVRSVFETARDTLGEINTNASKDAMIAQQKAAVLLAEVEALARVVNQNAAFAKNISVLLGDEPVKGSAELDQSK